MDVAKSPSIPKTGTVKWSEGGPTAPTIIPVVFFLVLIIAVICLLLKYIKMLWDRKRRSDIYEIVDLMEEDRAATENSVPFKKGTDATLSSIRFTGVKIHPKEEENYLNTSGDTIDPDKDSVDALSNGRVSLQVEANVHDSSNDTNGSVSPIDQHGQLDAEDEEQSLQDERGDESANNTETLPLRNKKRNKKSKQNAPLAATESDV
jgi:hypothetical protein